MLTVYSYKNCSTCRTALKWLQEKGIEHEVKPIRETPPSFEELEIGLAALAGNTKGLFNTSGQTYRQLGLKDLLPNLSAKEQLEMMTAEGNLIKRPFVVDREKSLALVGFKSFDWEKALL